MEGGRRRLDGDDDDDDDDDEMCDQKRSRVARWALEEFFYPLFENEEEEVPAKCPLRRSRDRYLNLERMKRKGYNKRKKEEEWKEVGTGKVFKSEADIDAYLTARFLNDNKNTGDVCLAEYCNVLQCDKYYESLSSEAASSTREKDYVAKARGAHTTAHCYALAKTCFPERTGNAMQEKNARRFESVFCDTFIGLHQDGRNAFAHIRKQEYRYPGQQQRQQRVGNASSSNSSFLIVSSLFIFLGFIFYLLFMLNNHRACGSDLQARRGRPTASKKKSSLKYIAFDFLHRTLVLSGFKPKKKQY